MEIIRKEQKIVPPAFLHPGMIFYFLDTPQDIWLTTEKACFKSYEYCPYETLESILVVNIKTGALKILDFSKGDIPDVRLLDAKLIIEGE